MLVGSSHVHFRIVCNKLLSSAPPQSFASIARSCRVAQQVACRAQKHRLLPGRRCCQQGRAELPSGVPLPLPAAAPSPAPAGPRPRGHPSRPRAAPARAPWQHHSACSSTGPHTPLGQAAGGRPHPQRCHLPPAPLLLPESQRTPPWLPPARPWPAPAPPPRCRCRRHRQRRPCCAGPWAVAGARHRLLSSSHCGLAPAAWPAPRRGPRMVGSARMTCAGAGCRAQPQGGWARRMATLSSGSSVCAASQHGAFGRLA